MTMNEIHQDRISTEVDWLGGKLNPLREGKAVMFSLFIARGTGKRQNPLITITPGEQFGFRKKAVVVSVINNGSCIVEIDCNSTANLVLAGIPAKLAKILLAKLQSTLKEETHGNSTNPTRSSRKKRASSGSTGWTSTRKNSTSTITRTAYRESGKQ